MRHIKVRAWCPVFKEMFIPPSVEMTPIGLENYYINSIQGTSIKRILMLGSGVKDINGVEVFEGDIVEWIDSDGDKHIDTVVWKNGGLVMCNVLYTVGSYQGKELKVVGNKYEMDNG